MWPNQEKYDEDRFFEWADKFMGYKKQKYDDELLRVFMKLEYDDLVEWIKERYNSIDIGLQRALNLSALRREMSKRWRKALSSNGTMTSSVLQLLSIESLSNLAKHVL
jgi:hypothetical protein